MMLVLISLGTATILTTAYITARDNSATIGENVVYAAEARCAATTGLDLGVAVLETDSDWRTAHTGGVLINDYPIGGGTLDVLVEDVETGAPPTASTSRVKITSIATRNGVKQIASVMAQVEPSADDTGIDVDLSEFVVFVSGSAKFGDAATIARWPKAPASQFGDRINIGTRQTSAGGIEFKSTATTIDTTFYYQTGSSSSLVTNESGVTMKLEGLLDRIPLPDAPTAPTVAVVTSGDLKSGAATTVAANKMYNTIELTGASGRLNLDGNVTLVSSDDIRLSNNSGIVVNGNAVIVVTDELRMEDHSFIELQPGSTLSLYVNGSIAMSDAFIGGLRANRAKFDSSGALEYTNPDRINILTPSTGVIANVTKQSVIVANVYGSRLTLNVGDTSAIYGRVAARFLTMTGQSTIFYDHALDSRVGYTNTTSALYENDGHLKTSVNSLTSLSTASLQTLADALSSPISGLFGLLNPSGGSTSTAYSVGPGDPTPRVVTVDVTGRVEGSDFNNWEVKADGAVVLVRDDSGGDDSNVKTRSPGLVSMTP